MTLIATLRHRAALCGQVVDSLTGLGIPEARVRVTPGGILTHTRPDGSYGVTDLPDGAYDLIATVPRLGTRYGTVTVGAVTVASDPDGRPRLTPARLALPPTCLAGRVRHADTLAAIPFASLWLRASGEGVLADAAGVYRFAAIEAGAQTLIVSARGFVTSALQVEPAAGLEVMMDIELTPDRP